MPISDDPALLKAALLAVVSATSPTAEGGRLCKRLLRVAVEEIERAGTVEATARVRALEELAFSLGMAAQHADALAETGVMA